VVRPRQWIASGRLQRLSVGGEDQGLDRFFSISF
jgi:hypothetical protein